MIDGDLEAAKAEFVAALPDWWYVVEEMPGGETVVTVGPHNEDWTRVYRLKAATTAEALRHATREAVMAQGS